MGWKDIPPDLRDELLGRKVLGIPVENLAREVGMRPGTLDRRLREWANKDRHIARPKMKFKKWTDPPVFHGNAAITGDYHMPYVDYDFAETLLDMSKNLLGRPRRLIIAGDLFSFDSLSSHPQLNGYKIPLRREFDSTKDLLDDMDDVYDEIDVLLGNHERRLIYQLLGEMGSKELEALIGNSKVRFYEYSHCIMVTATGEWRATHQRNYSRNSQTVGVKLAHKFGQHVITHHQHKVSKGFDTSGKYVVIDNGCMADPDYLDWANAIDSTAPAMTQSFVILKDGAGLLFANNPAFSYYG